MLPTGQNIMNIGLTNGIRAQSSEMQNYDQQHNFDKQSNEGQSLINEKVFLNSESINT